MEELTGIWGSSRPYGSKKDWYYKIWNRYSETMFLPHRCVPKTGEFRPILDGVMASHFYQVLADQASMPDRGNMDSWDRFFNMAESMYENGMDVTEACYRMCRIMMSRDERMREMIRKNLRPQDYFTIKKRMIGTGMIGGKATGMLLAKTEKGPPRQAFESLNMVSCVCTIFRSRKAGRGSPY